MSIFYISSENKPYFLHAIKVNASPYPLLSEDCKTTSMSRNPSRL